MWTPNLMAIMWTLGRFEKFNTWHDQIFEKFEQRIQKKSWWTYLALFNMHHKIWRNRNVLQKWGYRFIFLYEILREKQQCYKKKKLKKNWELCHIC
jgi:hypothetical protein